jgi:hypothetical protein
VAPRQAFGSGEGEAESGDASDRRIARERLAAAAQRRRQGRVGHEVGGGSVRKGDGEGSHMIWIV